MISNKMYDYLKWVAQIGLPGLGTFYASMGQIWAEVPAEEQVVATIVAVDAMLGLYLGLSTQQYKKSEASYQGYLSQKGIDSDTGMPHLTATFTELPQELLERGYVTLKVGNAPAPPTPPIEEH